MNEKNVPQSLPPQKGVKVIASNNQGSFEREVNEYIAFLHNSDQRVLDVKFSTTEANSVGANLTTYYAMILSEKA